MPDATYVGAGMPCGQCGNPLTPGQPHKCGRVGNPYTPSADWKPGQDTFTSQAAGIWAEGFVAGRAAFDAVVAERDRLRQQNHDAAAERDRKQAAMESELAEFRNAYKRAREVTRDFTVDWTTDPPSQQRYGWWRYSSVDMKDTLTALVAERDAASEVLALIYVMLTGAEPMWAEMPFDERCARAANEAQQAFLAVSGSSEPRKETT